jgi:hypothetical protein
MSAEGQLEILAETDVLVVGAGTLFLCIELTTQDHVEAQQGSFSLI